MFGETYLHSQLLGDRGGKEGGRKGGKKERNEGRREGGTEREKGREGGKSCSKQRYKPKELTLLFLPNKMVTMQHTVWVFSSVSSHIPRRIHSPSLTLKTQTCDPPGSQWV